MLVEYKQLLMFVNDVFRYCIRTGRVYEFRDLLQQIAEQWLVFWRILRNHDIQPFRKHFYLQRLPAHNRVTVEMKHTFMLPVNPDFLASQCFYPAVLVDGLVEKLIGE